MRRLLVVDDDARFRGLLRMLFEDAAEFDLVGEAADGGDALLAARQLAPEVVLLDVNLPDTTGFTLVPLLAEAHDGPVAVVMTSSRGDDSYEQLARDAGARAFISKHDLSVAALARALA